MIRDPRFHRWRHAQAGVNLAKVVDREVQRNRGLMVLELLAEGVSQAGEPADLHTHREVLALDVAGRNLRFIGVTAHNDLFAADALGGRKEESAPVPLFLAHKNLKPFAEKHLGGVHLELQQYRTERGSSARGIPAAMLPKICEVWMDANKANVLGPRQQITATRAEILFRGFAHVGIIALVDEATGYQQIRAREALQAILDAYLRKELAAWAKRFPDEFYEQMFRLRKWNWKGMKVNRPQIVGHYTNDLVWERLAPGIREELESKNPKNQRGHRKSKHHQWLTEDVGHPALAQHLYGLIGFMRASDTWEQFYRLVGVFRREDMLVGQPLVIHYDLPHL